MTYFNSFPVWSWFNPFYPYKGHDEKTQFIHYFDYFTELLEEYDRKSRFWHPSEGKEIYEFICSCLDSHNKIVDIEKILEYIVRIVREKKNTILGIRPKIAEQLLLSISTILIGTNWTSKSNFSLDSIKKNNYIGTLKSMFFCYTRINIPNYLPSNEPLFEKQKPKLQEKPICGVSTKHNLCVMCNGWAVGKCPHCGKYLCDKLEEYVYGSSKTIWGCAKKHPCLI